VQTFFKKNNSKPIIFVFGPSGVGKSYLLNLLKRQKFQLMHIEDRGDKTFAAYGFHSEWDNDFSRVDFNIFIIRLREWLKDKNNGIVVSFPTVCRFTSESLDLLRQMGVTPILLWGSEKNCKRSAEIRRKKKGGQFKLGRYDRNNLPTFQLYSRPEYDTYRLEAFRVDGSRFSDEELNQQIADLIRKFSSG